MKPNSHPTVIPSSQPSGEPTAKPNSVPTSIPSRQPSSHPTFEPTNQPTSKPSSQPVSRPSSQPSLQPSSVPSVEPTCQPTINPTQPSSQPTAQPSSRPAAYPTSFPTCQPTSQPSTNFAARIIGLFSATFTVSQEIANMTKDQFLRPPTKSAFIYAVVTSLNSNAPVNVSITNVTDIFVSGSSRRELGAMMRSVSVTYNVQFYYSSSFTNAQMIALYSTLSSNLLNAVASGSFQNAYASSCPTCGGLATIIPSFTDPLSTTSFSPSVEPTFAPTFVSLSNGASAASAGVSMTMLMLAVIGIIALVVGFLAFTIVIMTIRKKKKVTESRLEMWMNTDKSEVDIHKSKNIRSGFAAEKDISIKDIYGDDNVDKIPSLLNPVFYGSENNSKDFGKSSQFDGNDNDDIMANTDSKRQTLKKFFNNLQEMRRDSYIEGSSELSSLTELFDEKKTSDNGQPVDSQDLTVVLKKFHEELRKYRDKTVIDPTIYGKPVTTVSSSSDENKETSSDELSILQLYKDSSNPDYTDV